MVVAEPMNNTSNWWKGRTAGIYLEKNQLLYFHIVLDVLLNFKF